MENKEQVVFCADISLMSGFLLSSQKVLMKDYYSDIIFLIYLRHCFL